MKTSSGQPANIAEKSKCVYINKKDKSAFFISCFLIIFLALNNYAQDGLLNKLGVPADTIVPPYLKDNFRINSLDGIYGSSQLNVSCAMDGNGYFAFAWADERNNGDDIFAQFYDNNGSRIGTNFKVNREMRPIFDGPRIATNKNGDFLITWRQDFQNIVIQRFNHMGQKKGDTIIVNNKDSYYICNSSAAVNDDGSFIITWCSDSAAGDLSYIIYARLFNSGGEPVGNSITVNEPGKKTSRSSAEIAVDDEGNYCIVWGSDSTVYLQMITDDGHLNGTNIKVNNESENSSVSPGVSCTNDGTFLIAWDIYNSNPELIATHGRLYNKEGFFTSDVINISGREVRFNPLNISSDRDSIFYLILHNYEKEYLQKIKSNGDFLGDKIEINFNGTIPDETSINQISNIINNRFVAAIEVIDVDENVYLQEFDKEINPVGSFQRINDDYQSSSQVAPKVKFNNRGGSIVSWVDWRNRKTEIYARVYDENFNPAGDNFKVDENASDYWFAESMDMQSLSDGTFIICYSGFDDTYLSKVQMQAISTAGEKIGTNITVKDSLHGSVNMVININKNDEILVCWYDASQASLRLYNKNFEAITGSKQFMTAQTHHMFNPFVISIDTAFNIMSVWKDSYNYTQGDIIYGAFYNKFGEAEGDAFNIDTTFYVVNFSCKNYGKNYIVMFGDDTNLKIKRSYVRESNYRIEDVLSLNRLPFRYDIVKFENEKLFLTYTITDIIRYKCNVIGYFCDDEIHSAEFYNLHTFEQFEYNKHNSCDFFEDKMFMTFDGSLDNGTGSDIWGNVRKIGNFKPDYTQVITSFNLSQNYPNPFNPTTKINYSITSRQQVTLKVYDILGRQIELLVNEEKPAGNYTAMFDGSKLASGIYFYRLTAGDYKMVKKMVLVK